MNQNLLNKLKRKKGENKKIKNKNQSKQIKINYLNLPIKQNNRFKKLA